MTHSIRSTIDRRLLLNLRVEPEVAQRLLPAPLAPQLIGGWAVAGVCFLRLSGVRPAGLPSIGMTSENMAHRLAVVHETPEGIVPGVYVPRRDTSSRLAALLGGRLLEGELSRATFEVSDSGRRLSIGVRGRGGLEVDVSARESEWANSELFSSIEDECRFFQEGRVAYSPNRRRNVVEAVSLESTRWTATPMTVEHFRSSVFDDAATFPRGTWSVDSAMLIRNVHATWHPAAGLRSTAGVRPTDSARS